MAQTVAFVGLGAMGSGMARCLIRKGFVVRAFDTRPAAVEEFAAHGGQACRSAAEAADGAQAAVVIVLTADQAEESTFGERGLARTLPKGSAVACMTTMSPARARSLGEQAAENGLAWLDAPVSGGTLRAADGTLTSMVGAETPDLERARPVLEAFSREIFPPGPRWLGLDGQDGQSDPGVLQSRRHRGGDDAVSKDRRRHACGV